MGLKLGVGFNWFTDYEVIEEELDCGFYKIPIQDIKFVNHFSTSHSYGNRAKLQTIFYKYLGMKIPTIMYDYELELINPSTMSKLCDKLLQNEDIYDLEDMRDRIEWIKQISDEGFYVCYDLN